MTTQTEATYIQGVLHPDIPLPLPDGSRVSLQVQSPIPEKPVHSADAFEELEEYLKENPINSGGILTQPNAFQEFLDFRERHPVNLGGTKLNREDLYDCG